MKNEYHQKHKERLRTEARKKNITIFLKKKKKKGEKRPKTDINNLLKKKKKERQYYCELNKNLPEEQKQKLAEYRKLLYNM